MSSPVTGYGCMARWKRLDCPGEEICRLIPTEKGWHLAGSADFEHDGRSCRLDYEIDCDSSWVTRSASVSGAAGGEPVDVTVRRSNDGRWTLNGRPEKTVAGCVDIDLNFSPSTNLLPIRRCSIDVGGSVTVRAAWLRFPSFALEPLEQRYTRLGPASYRYESGSGRFSAELTCDPATGLVIEYGNIWVREMSPGPPAGGATPR